MGRREGDKKRDRGGEKGKKGGGREKEKFQSITLHH